MELKKQVVNLDAKEEYILINFFRIVFSICVIIIHINPFYGINPILRVIISDGICRLAVPFFFLTSGFFIEKKIISKKIGNYLVALVRMYCLYALLYLPIVIHNNYEYVYNFKIFIIKVVKTILIGGMGYHLWFFIALIVAVIVLYFLVNIIKLDDLLILKLCILLYVIGVLGNAYRVCFTSLINQSLILSLYFKFFSTRNGIFFGLPFVTIGYLISKYRKKIFKIRYEWLLIISTIFMFIEVVLLRYYFKSKIFDMYFTILPTSVLMFILILFVPINSKYNKLGNNLKKMSILCYGLHLFLQFYINELLLMIYGKSISNTLMFILVIVSNIMLGELVIYLSNRKYFKWMKYFY